MASPIVSAAAGWRAELRLGFIHDGARTVLSQREHCGPLQVQRAFYPEPHGACHVYILHPPGGVVGGDELSIEISLAEDAQVLATTPAAGKFYRSQDLPARLNQQFRVAPRAMLEWFPQENIVFDGAHARWQTRVDLAENSLFMGWEITCLGRPANRESFSAGELRMGLEIWRAGTPLCIERGRFTGGAATLSAPWGMAGHAVLGNFMCTAPSPETVAVVREATRALVGDGLFGVTRLDELLVCRYLGDSAPHARQLFQRAWEVLRPRVCGREACAPRIWQT